MHRLSASLLFLLAGTMTLAQTSSNPPTAPKNPPNNTSTNGQTLGAIAQYLGTIGCPVGFTASRQSNGQIISAYDSTQSGPAQGLHLKLNHRSSTPDIQSIEVTVYGTSQNGLFLPVGTQSTSTVSKTFDLHRTSGSTSLSDADVSMHLVGSLSWADLISITYTDGTTWHATENLKCRAIPSNFLLVGAK